MGNTSGGLTQTDVDILHHLDPYSWQKALEKTVKGLARGGTGPSFDKLLKDYVPGYKPPPEKEDPHHSVKKAGVGFNPEEDDYPDEDEDTYRENAPPGAKRPKVDPFWHHAEGGVASSDGAAAAAGAAAPDPHHNPPPPPAQESDRNRAGEATAFGASRTKTVTETEEEPEMSEEGSASTGGEHDPAIRQLPPHIDINYKGDGNIVCTINVRRKCVFKSDDNPWKRYVPEETFIRTQHPLIKATGGQSEWDVWKLQLVNTEWKTLDINCWANFIDFPLYNYMINNVKRFKVDTMRMGLRNIFVRDINTDPVSKHTTYDLTEDGRLQLIVDHSNYIPYYSSMGFVAFGDNPHTAFEPWDFYYPLYHHDYKKNPIYYLEHHPFMELVGKDGTDIFYAFQDAHWKDLRIFRKPTFFRGHRWFRAKGKAKTNPYGGFTLGPEIAVEGAQWNATGHASRENHPSIVDYVNNKGSNYTAQRTENVNTTMFEGPSDFFNFTDNNEERDDFYQYNDTQRSFMMGKSKGFFHDGWGERCQQYIHDTDNTSSAANGGNKYVGADEELVNWKVPYPGVGTTGETIVLNGPIWHLPAEGVSYPRGLGACSPLPESFPQVFCRIKDQYISASQVRQQMVNFDVEMEMQLTFETKDYFNPCIFNQIPDEWHTIPGGCLANHECNAQGQSGQQCSVLEYWHKSKESYKVLQGNIYYPQ